MICWKLWKHAASALWSSVPSTSPRAGIPVLTQILIPAARFPKQLWTVSSTTLMRSSLKAASPCGSAMAWSPPLPKAVRRMPDCPFNPSDSPCELETDLMILREAERESMEIFYAMREELHFYLKRTQLLETILTENNIPIPDYIGWSLALPAFLPGRAFPLKLLSEPWRSTDGSRLRQGGSFSPAPWLKISVHMALGFRYMHCDKI